MRTFIFGLVASASAVPGVNIYPDGEQPITYSWGGNFVSQERIEQSYKTDVPACQEEVLPSDYAMPDEYRKELVLCINYRLKQRGLIAVKANYSASQESKQPRP